MPYVTNGYIVAYAYACCKANKGAAGVDRQTLIV